MLAEYLESAIKFERLAAEEKDAATQSGIACGSRRRRQYRGKTRLPGEADIGLGSKCPKPCEPLYLANDRIMRAPPGAVLRRQDAHQFGPLPPHLPRLNK
jgi:hypothetical protein